MNFDTNFRALTGVDPFPWQRELFNLFEQARLPRSADLPTGLGKTSVVTVWLLALLAHPNNVPRRLVYVVNRRTVVDQTTSEVERLRKQLRGFTGNIIGMNGNGALKNSIG